MGAAIPFLMAKMAAGSAAGGAAAGAGAGAGITALPGGGLVNAPAASAAGGNILDTITGIAGAPSLPGGMMMSNILGVENPTARSTMDFVQRMNARGGSQIPQADQLESPGGGIILPQPRRSRRRMF